MDIRERIEQNEKKAQIIQAQLQQLQQTNQELLQALIRLDGQHTLLLELQAEEETNREEAKKDVQT